MKNEISSDGPAVVMDIHEKGPKTSIGEYVYTLLKDNIINWNLRPGQRISENEIAGIINLSRTPVREAFIKLSRENIIEIIPQKGSYISHIDMDIIDDIWFLRKNIEGPVMKTAAKKMDEKTLALLQDVLRNQHRAMNEKDYRTFFKNDELFHHTIYRAAGRERIWNIIHSYDAQYERLRMLTLYEYNDFDVLYGDHESILRAFQLHDVKTIQQIIRLHLDKMRSDLEGLAEKYPKYFK